MKLHLLIVGGGGGGYARMYLALSPYLSYSRPNLKMIGPDTGLTFVLENYIN